VTKDDSVINQYQYSVAWICASCHLNWNCWSSMHKDNQFREFIWVP